MHVSIFRPSAELSPFIPAIWYFKSEYGIPLEDSRVIVPNGHAKIIIPYKNKLTVANDLISLTTQEDKLFFAGLQQHPLSISSTPFSTETIGIEVTPKGIYHLFNLQMSAFTNHVLPIEEVFGAWGRRLTMQVCRAGGAEEKVVRLQNALRGILKLETANSLLLDAVVDMITRSQGLITIQEIETKTGYSKRYLDSLFQHHIGISPKSLASILRFQKFYKEWAAQPSPDFFKADLHDHYYDQSHFIKDFKRYTGFAPVTYNHLKTDFGRSFYRVH